MREPVSDDALKGVIAKEYDSSAALFAANAGPVFRELGRPLVSAADLATGERVLDLAAGTGALARILRGRFGVAVDISIGQLRYNPSRFRICADAEHLPFAARSFDVVVSSFGVNHFPDPDLAIRESARATRSGGRVVIGTWLRPQPEYLPKEILLSAIATIKGRSRTAGAQQVDHLADRVGSEENLRDLMLRAGLSGVGTRVELLDIGWPGTSAFLDYRLAMAGMSDLLDERALREVRESAARALSSLNEDQLHWQPSILVAWGRVT